MKRIAQLTMSAPVRGGRSEPVQDLETDVTTLSGSHAVRLYSLDGMALASALGSVVAGAYCMWRNWRSLGDPEASWAALWFGVVGSALVFGAIWLEPEEWVLPDGLYHAVQGVATYLFARRAQGGLLRAHRDQGGGFYSRWRAVGVGVLVSVVAVALFFGFLILWSPEDLP